MLDINAALRAEFDRLDKELVEEEESEQSCPPVLTPFDKFKAARSFEERAKMKRESEEQGFRNNPVLHLKSKTGWSDKVLASRLRISATTAARWMREPGKTTLEALRRAEVVLTEISRRS